jgi:hypothetical protein
MASPDYSTMQHNVFGPIPLSSTSTHVPDEPQIEPNHTYLLSALNDANPPMLSVKPKPAALTAVTNGIGPIRPQEESGNNETDRTGFLFGRQFNDLGPVDEPTQELDTAQSALDQLFGEARPDTRTGEVDLSFIDPALSGPSIPPDNDHAVPDHPDNASHTNQGAKRKATSRANMLARGAACEFCKKRKLKCSAESPSCMACLRAGRDCIYSQKKQRSRVRVLEDRLMELEKRLGVQDEPVEVAQPDEVEVVNEQEQVRVTPATTVLDTPGSSLTAVGAVQWELFGGIHPATPDVGFTLESPDSSRLYEKGGSTSTKEPDLMTLADAAAADNVELVGPQGGTVARGYPWEGMSAEEIAIEMLRAVEGGKDTGEKLVIHL